MLLKSGPQPVLVSHIQATSLKLACGDSTIGPSEKAGEPMALPLAASICLRLAEALSEACKLVAHLLWEALAKEIKVLFD